MVMNEKLFNNLSKYFHGNKKTDKKELVSYFKYKHASSGKLFELQNGLNGVGKMHFINAK